MRAAIHPHPQYAFTTWCPVKNKAQGQIYLIIYFKNLAKSRNFS